jgi:VIT1/CCC1 family predicted Fe2+/Mn2+ transporter
LITILIVILVLMLIGALPSWPHSRNWGYRPVGGLGLIVVIVLILYLLNYI